MKLKQLVFIMALCTSAHAGEFKLLTNIKSDAVSSVLKEITDELPARMKETIGKAVTVEFKNLNKASLSGIDDTCSENIIVGRDIMLDSNSTIEVENVFAKEIQKGNRKINCNHKDIKTYMKATIVHELAHMYDQKKKISKSPLFLNIGGWIAKGLIIKKRTNLNQLNERSPDRYEFKNSAETFAVNFEYFLYDSEFKCRRQTYYEYYSNIFGTKPGIEKSCEAIKKIVVTAGISNTKTEASLVRDMDFSRLYQVHYLFAGKGKQAMSRFGHAMYRLVFCAPGKVKGPSCMNDTAYHVVLSFRANVQDITTSYTKGMNGEYPSQLFFLPLTDVINEYTKGEFRDVTSLPLKLTDAQATRFVARASELFWGYKGKYYFLTNNCATEALYLLKVARGEDNDLQVKNITTPSGLYSYLIDMGLGDTSVLSDAKSAEKKGFFFPGVGEKILASLKVLGIKEKDFAKFVENNKSAKRMKIYQAAIDKSESKLKMTANALRVEDLIAQSEEIRFAKKIGDLIFGEDADPTLKADLGDKVIELQHLQEQLSADNYLKAGYGVPLVGEFDSIPQTKIDEVGILSIEYASKMKDLVMEFFPEDVKEIQAIAVNRSNLINMIALINNGTIK